jgi:cytochrome b6-f complex iron-sulfur subunit
MIKSLPPMTTPNSDRLDLSESVSSSKPFHRRHFLRYLVGSTAGTIAIGFLFPSRSTSIEATLEDICSSAPLNSRCRDYLPGVQAQDEQGKPIAADMLIAKAKVGEPIAVKGLSNPEVSYLVILEASTIAPFAIKPICTHLGCTVNWKPDQNRFVCPCHGSQYDAQGRVIHGPARRALPLRTVVVKQNQIRLVDRAPAIDPR